MKLLPNWRLIARRSHSFWLAVVAAILTGVEVVLPVFQSQIPPQFFAIASFVCVTAAAFARLVVQGNLANDD